MAREFALPDLGEGITEAQVVDVLVADGDQVAEDQSLMEVETDKATVPIPFAVRGHNPEGCTCRRARPSRSAM